MRQQQTVGQDRISPPDRQIPVLEAVESDDSTTKRHDLERISA